MLNHFPFRIGCPFELDDWSARESLAVPSSTMIRGSRRWQSVLRHRASWSCLVFDPTRSPSPISQSPRPNQSRLKPQRRTLDSTRVDVRSMSLIVPLDCVTKILVISRITEKFSAKTHINSLEILSCKLYVMLHDSCRQEKNVLTLYQAHSQVTLVKFHFQEVYEFFVTPVPSNPRPWRWHNIPYQARPICPNRL